VPSLSFAHEVLVDGGQTAGDWQREEAASWCEGSAIELCLYM
jgi:hypothetical protein